MVEVEEVRPLTQYHSLFSANRSLEEALKGRIDLKRKNYEYSRNNMISNRVAQGNYLYSCAAFRRFSPNFKAFLVSADVEYHISDDLYQYMIDNKAPPTLIKQFNDVFVHSADNKDFFEWSEVANGMLMPDQGLLQQLRQPTPQTLEKVSDKQHQEAPGVQLAFPFVVEVKDQYDKPLAEVQVNFLVASGGGTLSATSVTTDANGRAESTLTLGPEPGTNTVVAAVAGVQGQQTFTAEGVRLPITLEKISGDYQEELPGATLDNPFVVEVRDQSDEPLPGAEVMFSVSGGGGTLSATSVTTDANGRAERILTLGPNPGANTVSVSVAGIEEMQTFTAEGIRIPLAFWIISGSDQQGQTGAALENPFAVQVRDQTGEPLPGVQVTFSVSSGGGTLSTTSATTDSNGRAESILTLGPNLGLNTVAVAVTGIQESQTVAATAESPRIPEDVNGDDVVNIFDLMLVAQAISSGGGEGDVNGDGVVNVFDLVQVAGAIGVGGAAP